MINILSEYASNIHDQVLEILKKEDTVVDVPVPNGEHVNVCGDVHGQVQLSSLKDLMLRLMKYPLATTVLRSLQYF